MQAPLSAECFGRLQIAAFADKGFRRKCRLCSYGHEDGPAYSDEICHRCLLLKIKDSVSDVK